MSVTYTVTVQATQPLTLELEVDMATPKPTEPLAQAEWTERLDKRVAIALHEKAEELEMDGYLAEWIVNYAGGWEVTATEEQP